MFFCVCICLFQNIGNNRPFPLLINCTLPIASLDLIYCIYILFDTFYFITNRNNGSLTNIGSLTEMVALSLSFFQRLTIRHMPLVGWVPNSLFRAQWTHFTLSRIAFGYLTARNWRNLKTCKTIKLFCISILRTYSPHT